ncbi:MAG: type II toxin-antitoxin system RelE/ParE family toxin [Acidobacteriota bacterium]
MSSRVVSVRLSTHARRFYKRLHRSDRRVFDRLDRSLDRIADQPEVGKPLVGPLKGHRSLRVGPLRIIYRLDDKTGDVWVLEIGPRGGAYR